MRKKIISFSVIFAILLSVLPYSAHGAYTNKDTFWNWLHGESAGIVKTVIGYAAGSVCTKSADGYHHATSYERDGGNGYYMCICTECGDRFKAYASDLQTAYDSYVDTLPAGGYNSSGEYVYTTGWILHEILVGDTDVKSEIANYDGKSTIHINTSGLDMFEFNPHFYLRFYITPETDLYLTLRRPSEFACTTSLGQTVRRGNVFLYAASTDTAVTGRLSDGKTGSTIWPSADFETITYTLPAGQTFYIWDSFNIARGNLKDFVGYLSLSLPTFTATPITPPAVDPYTIDSRVGSFTGDYGILGDNGTIIKSDTQHIVDEINSTVYNPVTNTTSTITDWRYDYSTRTYTVTTGAGDTQTITYGDEFITIEEGYITYNVYYLTEGTGSGTTCTHEYTATTTKAATCTASGQETYTCSLCGDAYTQRIAAAGHDWNVVQHVPTEYDETGQLITQGYTIFQCATCSEQYKDENGIGPPNSSTDTDDGDSDSGGGIFDGIFGALGSILGGLLSGLLSLLEALLEQVGKIISMVGELFGHIPEWFTGFTGFLSAIFSFLPSEFMTILLFGLLALVVVAVIKRFIA